MFVVSNPVDILTQLAVERLDLPWQHHMVERFLQLGDELFAVLSNGEFWLTSLGIITWERILPQVAHVHAAAGY